MPKRFFDLHDDVYYPNRWHLGMPRDDQHRMVNGADFRRGKPFQPPGRLTIPLEVAGTPLDFTEAGVSIPVVHVRVADVLAKLASDDVQLLPVNIESHPDQYLILVVLHRIPCIDEKTSRISLWTHEDGVPHKVGQYASVRDMRIDKTRVGNRKLLRPEGWATTLIVSEEIKEALERMGATGTRFEEV